MFHDNLAKKLMSILFKYVVILRNRAIAHKLACIISVLVMASVIGWFWLYSLRTAEVVEVDHFCLAFSNAFWWTCMDRASWAGWAQAVGAVVAIVAAIAIATSEARDRRSAALTRAYVVRPAAYLQLKNGISCIDNLISVLESESTVSDQDLVKRVLKQAEENSKKMECVKHAVGNVGFPTDSITLELGPIKFFSQSFFRGQIGFFKCIDDINDLNANNYEVKRKSIVEDLKISRENLQDALRALM